MTSITYLILCPFLALVLYKVFTAIITRHKHAELAKNLGCKPVPVYPDKDPLGIYNIIQIIKSNNAGRLPHYVVERIETTSKQEGREVLTFKTHIFRNWLHFTSDPKNIQALLATQFKDFCLGPIRFGTFSPL